MTKKQEYQAQILTLKNEAQALLDEGKTDEAKAKFQTIKDLKNKIELQDMLDDIDIDDVKDRVKKELPKNVQKSTASFIKASIKKLTGKKLTEAENALLLPSESAPTGDNGESYILPQEFQTLIIKLSRQFNSIREDIGYVKVGSLTGGMPIEDIDSIQELIDFSDGAELSETEDFSFRNIPFALKEKGALIPVSNTLLALSDEDLLAYVAGIFAKKASLTEAKMGFAELRRGKVAKQLDSYKTLKTLTNTVLNPAVLGNTRILTNQHGFDWLSELHLPDGTLAMKIDENNPRQGKIYGHLVKMYPNNQLPNTAEGKAPYFIGATTEGAKLFELGITAFAASSHAGFKNNTTLTRLIEFIDARQFDGSDACYFYAESPLTDAASVSDEGEEPAEG